jgi:molybdopterin/thiamine biosynthesis adenylyltransferase
MDGEDALKLNALDQERYSRHLRLPEIGTEGQERLLDSSVLVVGAGGLGSPAALYLAAAGVGHLGVADGDDLDLSNLQRQILHSTGRVGEGKVLSAAASIRRLNPGVTVEEHPCMLTEENAAELVDGYQFVVDATDNFDAKFLIADTCHDAGVPYSHAGIDRFFGQTITVLPGRTACYRCLFGHAPEPDEEPPAGPLGAVPGVVGSIQAAEAVKYLLDVGRLLTDRLLTFDALEMQFREIPVRRNPTCPLCGEER